jgi:hypothetical protein
VVQTVANDAQGIVEEITRDVSPHVLIRHLNDPAVLYRPSLGDTVTMWRPHRWIQRVAPMTPPFRARVTYRDEEEEAWEAREDEDIPPFWIEPDLHLVCRGVTHIIDRVDLRASTLHVTYIDPARPHEAANEQIRFRDLLGFVPFPTPAVGESWAQWVEPGATVTVQRVVEVRGITTEIHVRDEGQPAGTPLVVIPFQDFAANYNRVRSVERISSFGGRRQLCTDSVDTPAWASPGVLVHNLTTLEVARIQDVSGSYRRPYVVLNGSSPRVWMDDLVREWVPLRPGSNPVTRPEEMPRPLSRSSLEGTLWVLQSTVGPTLVRVFDDLGARLRVVFPGSNHLAYIPAQQLAAHGRQAEHEISVNPLGGLLGNFRVGSHLRLADGRMCFVESMPSPHEIRLVSSMDVSDLHPMTLTAAPFQGPYPAELVLLSLRDRVSPEEPVAPSLNVGSLWLWLRGPAALLRVLDHASHHVDVEILPSGNVERLPLNDFWSNTSELVYRNSTSAYSPDLRAGQVLDMIPRVAVESVANGLLMFLSAEDVSQNDGRDYVTATPIHQEPPTTLGFPTAPRRIRGRTEFATILDDATWGTADLLDLSGETEHTARAIRSALGVPDLTSQATPSRPRPAAQPSTEVRRLHPASVMHANTSTLHLLLPDEETVNVGEVFEVPVPTKDGSTVLLCAAVVVADGLVHAQMATPITSTTSFRAGQIISSRGTLLSIRRLGEDARIAWVGPLDDFTREQPVRYDALTSAFLVGGTLTTTEDTPPPFGDEWVNTKTHRRCNVVEFDEVRRTARVRWTGGVEETVPIADLLRDFRGLTRGSTQKARTIQDAPGRELWTRLLDDDDVL